MDDAIVVAGDPRAVLLDVPFLAFLLLIARLIGPGVTVAGGRAAGVAGPSPWWPRAPAPTRCPASVDSRSPGVVS